MRDLEMDDAQLTNAATRGTVPVEQDFHHPYKPYDVQLQFMRTVYDVLERGDGQVGILESPTGTVGLALISP